jgi:hypothetical protein
MPGQHSTPATAAHGSTLVRLLAMTLATALLYWLAGRVLASVWWFGFAGAAATAWPLWLYQRDVSLFERRLLLAGVTTEGSWIRRWFWPGHVSQVLHALLSLVWASLLLALAAVLQPAHWLVLGADLVFLSLLVGTVRHRLAG